MKILIAGLPKTGTTGLYKTIKDTLINEGHLTKCLFEPKNFDLFVNYFKYQSEKEFFVTKVMFSEFDLSDPIFENFEKRIMIVRDPRDRLVSQLLFRLLSNPKKYEHSFDLFIELLRYKEENPDKCSIIEINEITRLLGLGAFDFHALAKEFQEQCEFLKANDYFVIKYEDFVQEKFDDLSIYLNVPIKCNKSQDSWLKHIERSRGYGEWKNWFCPVDCKYLKQLFAPSMSTLGYIDDWVPNTKMKIDPKTSSIHVEKKLGNRLAQMKVLDDYKKNGGFLSESDFQLALSRAEDGRVGDIEAVSSTYLYGSELIARNITEAMKWNKWGSRLGLRTCKINLRNIYLNKI